jgi:hypothetical protein
MKKKRFIEEQVIGILRQVETSSVNGGCAKHKTTGKRQSALPVALGHGIDLLECSSIALCG